MFKCVSCGIVMSKECIGVIKHQPLYKLDNKLYMGVASYQCKKCYKEEKERA